MEYSAAGNELDDYLRGSQELEAMLYRAAVIGAAFWSAKSIVDTSFNSRAVLPLVTRDEHDRQMGLVYAWGHYARFREHGTRYNEPERVLHQAIKIIEAGP